jgi:BirA family transcriptional regulator, biotin operon repressor / biotin---[acetyl-CoA-carboxylase] ligase
MHWGTARLDVDRIVRETFVTRVEHHSTIGSTNDRAAECAGESGVVLPLVVVADRQTTGRGRGANRWWTGPGSLALSLLVDAQTVGADRGPSPLVALAAAMAVVDTIAPLLPAHQTGIHWPNDVLAAGRKLAGILIEALPDRRHIIGIGLNTNNTLADAPAELHATAATLRDLSGQIYNQTDILIGLLKRLEQAFVRLRHEPGAIAARADKLCLQRGQILTLGWSNRTITGLCQGIADDGAIRLETSAGVECFYSGILMGQPP